MANEACFDHVVVHVEGDAEIADLKADLAAQNIPFEPDWGKSASGFKISNIWVGREYFELVEITARESAWRAPWLKRHLNGERGAYCAFFRTDADLDAVYTRLVSAGIACSEVERTRFKWMFGLLEKKLPWRYVILPPMPGSTIEIGLIRYDRGALEKSKPYMVPNGDEVGLTALTDARISTTDRTAATSYLKKIEQIAGRPLDLTVDETGPDNSALSLRLQTADPSSSQKIFRVADVTVQSAS